jgi:uncharacterized protein YdhG (YjbR/CyaY superfamily)
MSEVDAYLANVNPDQRQELEHIRQLVKRIAPQAQEVISYGMPGFKLNGHYLLGYAAFKNHLSFFPTSEPVEVFRDQLKSYTCSRGTIQFTSTNRLPDQLITDIILFRVEKCNQEAK